MTDQELEQRLRSWYRAEIPKEETAPAALRSRVRAIPVTVTARWRRSGSRGFTLLAAAALATVLAGTALIGGLPQPDQRIAPTPPPSAQVSASAEPPATAAPGRIVYTRRVRLANGEGDCTTRFLFCHRSSVVISNADGSDERELVPGPSSALLAASPDGSQLLVSIPEADVVRWYLTDASGSTPQRLQLLCEAPCYDDYAFAFSPDGTRLAFVRTFAEEIDVPPWQLGTSLIAIMDMGTGTVVELESTMGYAAAPGWSPDGSRLVFANHAVDADGSNLQQIAPATLFTGMAGEFAGSPTPSQWSPDGSLIVFTSFNDTVTTDPPDNSQRLMDIYVVRPDGAGLQRLTTDTGPPLGTNDAGDFGAAFPAWTRDGRIVFTRFPMSPEAEFELWVMDSDGSNAARLDPSDAAALTALGCVACTYPALADYDLPNFAYWIPGR